MNDPNQFPQDIPVQNLGYRISDSRDPRYFENPCIQNVSDMINNHSTNLAHNQTQMVPRHISQRQQAIYLPSNVAYQGTTNHQAYYPFSPQQASQAAVIMPYADYPTNQQGMFYSQFTTQIQRTNLPHGPPNFPIINMSNVQNPYGQSLIVQSRPMNFNTEPLEQVSQHLLTRPMQTIEASSRPMRKKVPIKIIDPNTGREVDLNNSLQGPPSADELEKMKVQIKFQSQVRNNFIKDDTKLSDHNLVNAGDEKLQNKCQLQVTQLANERTLVPSKAIEVVTQVSKEIISEVEETSVVSSNIKELPIGIRDSINIDIGGLTINTENTTESEIETTLTNILPNSTTPLEVQIQNADVTNISEDPILLKKNTDKESVKSANPNKTDIKKKKKNQQKNLVKPYAYDGMKADNKIKTTTIELGIESKTTDILKHKGTKQNENNNHNFKTEKEERIIPKLEEILEQLEETQNNRIQHEPVVEDAASKLPSYLQNLPYVEGQWSVTNPSGKKVYSKLFLIQLGNEAICQKKPDVLRNWRKLTKLAIAPQFYSLGSTALNLTMYQSACATRFITSYFKPNNSICGSGMPIVQPDSKHNCDQRKTTDPNTIHKSLCKRKKVKLNHSENAWVPTAAKKATKSEVVMMKNEEEQKNDEVNKSVRSILNKITPDNMSSLTDHFKALPIDTIERLEKTIDLVFEKAIEEQSFTPLYSSLCSAMQSVQVNSKDGKTTSFKKLLISKCQSLFELDKAQEMYSAKKLTEINSCKDPEKKKKLQVEFEENEKKLRKRSVGNCRFIGELFKQKILTPNIMLYCITHLVTKRVEEPLECLCNLLKTIGKELEQSYNLNNTFNKLKALTSKNLKHKIPPRIKFMIQDVIDLRKDKWIPRHTVSTPKMINEIENEVKNETIEQQSLSPEKRDCRRDDGKFKDGKNKSRRGNENEWNTVQYNIKYKLQNYTLDQSKLQGFKESATVKTLDSPKWSFTTDKNMTSLSRNQHSVLNDYKKSSNSSQPMSNKNLSRKPVISKTEKRQRMMSGAANMIPQFPQPTPSINSSSLQYKETVEGPMSELDSEMANKIYIKCKNILLEYEQMQNVDDIIYSLSEDETSVIRTRHEEFVKSMILITLDSSPITLRTVAGNIFAKLLSKKILSMETITRGIDAVLKDWNDYLIDYPQFFSYTSAIIAPLLLSQCASFDFNNLKDSCTSIRPENSSIFFTEVLNKILGSKETPNIEKQIGGILWIYDKWLALKHVSLDVFIPDNQINKYFKNDQIGVFLLSIAIYDKLKMADSKLLYGILHSWINNNISAEIIKCPQFVQALTIAIVIVCLKMNHSHEDFFDHVKLLNNYIRLEPLPEFEIQAREVQCLYGIQIMFAAFEHPSGMILKLFHKLYQDSIISKESFELWMKEDKFKAGFDEDIETKTTDVVVLNSFFPSLVANNSDENKTTEK